MNLHHTFSRVYAWLSGMLAQPLTPRIRSRLGFAVVLLGVLTVVHVNFVAQISFPFSFKWKSSWNG
uniref:Uncharacterized protein n=1 Tax=Picea sitchensis TaxID=3332 RepID=A9NM75_PICSI|nr:unknown [Picea sitchensis]ABK22656.1 unknown [Picea sitchensis]